MTVRSRIRRAEDRDRGNRERRGEMERTAVVRDDHRAVRDRGGKLQDVAFVADDRQAVAGRGNRLCLFPLARARQQHHFEAIGAQARRDFDVAIVAPVLRASVETAGVDAEQRPVDADAERPKPHPRFFAYCNGQLDRRDLVDHARRAHRGEQRRVVVELMAALSARGGGASGAGGGSRSSSPSARRCRQRTPSSRRGTSSGGSPRGGTCRCGGCGCGRAYRRSTR